jgi:hypothetical protein
MIYNCRDMPTIQSFFDCDAFIRGLMGPFGSAKSSACTIEIGQRGIAVPPGPDGVRRSRYAVVRNTNKQLEDTTERTFLQWFPPITYGDWVPSRHDYTIKALKAEGDDRGSVIEVMFRALDREDQVADLLSLELTGAWVNEAREIPWGVVEALQGRVGRYPRRADVGPFWRGLWMDTNAPDVESDWYKFFETADLTEAVAAVAKRIPGMTVETYRRIFKQPSGRSPQAENLRNLQDGYYELLAVGKSPEWIKIYVDGQYGFMVDGKAVWPEYSDALHCPTDADKMPRPVESQPIVRSWDCTGLNPACVFSQITPRGQWIVFDERVGTAMGADAFSDDVIEHSARFYPGSKFEFWDVGDPAGMNPAGHDKRTYFQIIQSKGIPIEPAIQTLSIRLESVRKPLRTLIDGRPQFVLHPRCTQTRRALLGGYHFRRLRISGERYTNEPEKNIWSNPADALAYGATRLFGAGLITPRNNHGQMEEQHASGRRNTTTGY